MVEDYVEKAGLTDKLESVVVLDRLSSRDLQATARAAINPFFLQIVGIEAFDAQAGSRAAQAITNVEITLVLDVSGSMLGAKIANLRAAASHFVAGMLDSDPNQRVSISVVPYNAQVHLGTGPSGPDPALQVQGAPCAHCHGCTQLGIAELGLWRGRTDTAAPCKIAISTPPTRPVPRSNRI